MIVAVQIDPLESLNQHTDTSLFLCEEAISLGYTVYTFQPSSLQYRDQSLWAQVSRVERSDLSQIASLPSQLLNLDEVDIILVRQDPPFDMAYLANTYLLDHAKARVINAPHALRHVSEKMSALYFPHFIPPTVMSYKAEDILVFLKVHHKAILKPLFHCGGEGITLLEEPDPNLSAVLSHFQKTYPGPFLVQKFLPTIQTEGDKRIFILDGDVVAAYGRKPAPESICANTRQNGSIFACTLTERDLIIAQEVGAWLKAQGVFLAGIDLIGDYLIEINVTSPTGFRAVQHLYGMNLANLFWEKAKTQNKF